MPVCIDMHMGAEPQGSAPILMLLYVGYRGTVLLLLSASIHAIASSRLAPMVSVLPHVIFYWNSTHGVCAKAGMT